MMPSGGHVLSAHVLDSLMLVIGNKNHEYA